MKRAKGPKIVRPKNKSFHRTRSAAVRLAGLIRRGGQRASVERITNTRGQGGGYVVTSRRR